MSIPGFDHNNVIPPHLGDPRMPMLVSPFSTTTLELCQVLGFTAERRRILSKFLQFRLRLNENNIIQGFQWLDGSFLENIELTELRSPRDLDVVTFYAVESQDVQAEINNNFEEFFNSVIAKENYLLDHYVVDLLINPLSLVEHVKYWHQLFSHNRNRVWKGMLKLELNTSDLDQQALEYLGGFNDE